jgi:hypothetical protein
MGVRCLFYGNAYVMPLSDTCDDHPKNAVPVGDDGDYEWTGWWEGSCEQCDTYWSFGGGVVNWVELPQAAEFNAFSALRLGVERLKADALILENNYSVAAQNEGALQAEVERLRKALETVIGDLEGYEDGAPDASYLSKTVNATLAQARAAFSSLGIKSAKGKAGK